MSQYFTAGVSAEQNLTEDLIVECLDITGTDIMYIPRTLVARDNIFNEDRLSEFRDAYKIRAYLDQIDNFDGGGAFIQKFGLAMEQSGTFVIARRVWENSIGIFGKTILPNRPAEGDLVYWPTSGGLFEIKFVTHQNPFYQLGKLFVYKLEVELFQYASEKIDTGIAAIDNFESLKSHDLNLNPDDYTALVNDYIFTDTHVEVTLNNFMNTVVNTTHTVLPAQPTIMYNVTDPIIDFIGTSDSAQIYLNNINLSHSIDTQPVNPIVTQPQVNGDNDNFKNAATNIGFNGRNIFGDLI